VTAGAAISGRDADVEVVSLRFPDGGTRRFGCGLPGY
jgi:hypothetical protein